MLEDKELVRRFLNKDNEAFEQIIIKYRKSGVAFANRYVHDMFTAEDIVQESFAYLYVYADRYNFKYSFKTYLFAIIKNKSIDYIRKANRISLQEEITIDEQIDNNIETEYIKKEQKALVHGYINKLNDDYRTIIYLIDIEGFSYKEASEIMDKSVAQIKILVFRARKKLKTIIEKEGI